MTFVALSAGLGGLWLSLYRGARIDASWPILVASLRRWLSRPPPPPAEDRELLSRLIAGLRSGVSLDSALESAAAALPAASPCSQRVRQLLSGDPPPDLLSRFLHSALRSGAPVLPALQNLERAFAARHRLTLRALAGTSQCRAQAAVLSWLPWALALGLAAADTAGFLGAMASPVSWALWAAALAITGAGRAWISRLLTHALQPASRTETWEERHLADTTLRALAELALGHDAETALERAIASCPEPELRRALASEAPGRFHALVCLLRHAARTGAPVREDLQLLLQDFQAEVELRWESRAQRLPVLLLLPLFSCFFPASLLVLAGVLWPLLRGLA